MVLLYDQNNVYFDPLQVLYDLINANVEDPNSERLSRPTEKDRKWIFPTFPEANDENYPRIAIVHGSITFDEWTPFQFDNFVTNPDGIVTKEVFSNLVTIPVTIGVFTKKTRFKPFEVADYDGTKRWVGNSALVAYLMDRVQKAIHANRNLFIEKDMDIYIVNMEGVYEDLDFLWAGSINVEIIAKNRWTSNIAPGNIIGGADQNPITSDDINLTVNRVC